METPTMELRSGTWLAGLWAGICFGGLTPCQASGGEGLKRPAKAPEAAQQDQAARRSPEQWIADLGNESYRVRLLAEKALRELGKEALPGLRKAAEEAKDNEVQWRVRRLISQIEGGSSGLQPRGAAPDDVGSPGAAPFDTDGLGGQFEEMFRQMERQFGLDIPRGRFFQDDFFRDLQDQMRAGQGLQRGMSMQIGPDGAVKVEVKETNEKGEVENKVYEAPDMESFQKQYPGVLQQNGLGGGLQFQFGPRGLPLMPGQLRARGLQMQPLQPLRPLQRDPNADPDQDLQIVPDQVPPPDGKRLGVLVRPEIPADVRDYLGLEDGLGLMVESVQDGSLAAALKLQRGDILTKIGATAIGGTEHVQEALGAIEAGKDVVVTFLRRGTERTATAAKPEVSAPSKTADEGQPSKRLRAKVR
ncbi:MAG: PDZ domain-containing protein [Planctomycetes bacterium]|nr:PDZ domain-containing protein [Planctomycetota bacterium]